MQADQPISMHLTIETLCDMTYREQYHEAEQGLLHLIQYVVVNNNKTPSLRNYLYDVYISFNEIYINWSMTNNKKVNHEMIKQRASIHPNYILSHMKFPPEMDDLLHNVLSLNVIPDAKKEATDALNIYMKSITTP